MREFSYRKKKGTKTNEEVSVKCTLKDHNLDHRMTECFGLERTLKS